MIIMITNRPSTPGDAKAIAGCVDAVARERRYLGNTSGFSAEQTRAFVTSLSDSGGIQIVVVANAAAFSARARKTAPGAGRSPRLHDQSHERASG
jgi:hypothetical protein